METKKVSGMSRRISFLNVEARVLRPRRQGPWNPSMFVPLRLGIILKRDWGN